MSNEEKNGEAAGRKVVWGFLVMGIIILLAGVLMSPSLQSDSVRKTEVLAGTALIISSIATLVITS